MKEFFREAIRQALLRFAPRTLCRIMAKRIGYPDIEMRLIPTLCDASGISIDVGAAGGRYTYLLLVQGSRCMSFEPRPEAADRMRENLSRHPGAQVEVVALSDRSGTTTLRILKEDLGRSTIDPHNRLEARGAVEEITVPIRPLSSYTFDGPVQFIKVDVEGHESEVLQGAWELLSRDHPSLIIEIEDRHRKGALAEVPTSLAELGYQGFFVWEGRIKSLIEFEADSHQASSRLTNRDKYVNNFIFAADTKKVATLNRMMETGTDIRHLPPRRRAPKPF